MDVVNQKRFSRTFLLCLPAAVFCGLVPLRLGADEATATNVVIGGSAGLSLAEAKQIASERNWDLLAAKSGIDAAQAQLIVAKEFPNPTVSLSTAKIGDRENSTSMGNGLWERNYDTHLRRQPVDRDRRQTP